MYTVYNIQCVTSNIIKYHHACSAGVWVFFTFFHLTKFVSHKKNFTVRSRSPRSNRLMLSFRLALRKRLAHLQEAAWQQRGSVATAWQQRGNNVTTTWQPKGWKNSEDLQQIWGNDRKCIQWVHVSAVVGTLCMVANWHSHVSVNCKGVCVAFPGCCEKLRPFHHLRSLQSGSIVQLSMLNLL